MKKKILFICGSLNQTSIMYEISQYLDEFGRCFTPYYGDGCVGALSDAGLLDFTVLGGRAKERTVDFLKGRDCPVDHQGKKYNYDLVVTCSDLIIPKNIHGKTIVLVQEGMTDPENWGYHLVRTLDLPRYLGNTSMTGLSHAYRTFCVASEGFRNLFIRKGVDPQKLSVTGIPNFDHAASLLQNDFPRRNYVLAATSHLRETIKFENRNKFIRKALDIADGRDVIFKLHPNENHERAIREIRALAPEAEIYTEGNTGHMIANSEALVTRYSSVLLIALALGKPVYSDINSDFLRTLTPIQNGGRSAGIIADICRTYLDA